jgi:hypothetical protein
MNWRSCSAAPGAANLPGGCNSACDIAPLCLPDGSPEVCLRTSTSLGVRLPRVFMPFGSTRARSRKRVSVNRLAEFAGARGKREATLKLDVARRHFQRRNNRLRRRGLCAWTCGSVVGPSAETLTRHPVGVSLSTSRKRQRSRISVASTVGRRIAAQTRSAERLAPPGSHMRARAGRQRRPFFYRAHSIGCVQAVFWGRSPSPRPGDVWRREPWESRASRDDRGVQGGCHTGLDARVAEGQSHAD